jgi:alpha-amylase/alpha-mannosidase (GH57 family)
MASGERYICIHGHFYQPPRENAWLETVEIQDSAAPYHDWNERITAECYAPNGASRILNAEDKIIRIVNNYSRISFNFGPTLLCWLQENAGGAHQTILDADRTSRERFGGHGSALAQVYNHIILPLANTRDRITQIRWGIADFENCFGRKPEGIWLAETAVDLESLDLLAQQGIRFTILAPHQCARIRPLTASTPEPSTPPPVPPLPEEADEGPLHHPWDDEPQDPWIETPNGTVPPTRPYRIALNEGRSIAVFFYDGPIARAVAFEGILNSGKSFAQRLLSGFGEQSADAQLVHIATDGESYGHHHKYGEMALSYALEWLEQHSDAKLTNYAEFLEKFPPTWEAEINENSSWSCAHGVERWRSDCGCNGGRAGWNQKWRTPLRESLDWLRDAIAPLAEAMAKPLLKDMWAARNAYIDVILHRSTETVQHFLDEHATHPLSPAERALSLKLMEMERHALLMYTSCGWFFDDISGIETVQVIAYAGRVLQLAAELFGNAGVALEKEFLTQLQAAKSNVPEQKDGAAIYRRYVQNQRIGLEQVGAHYAIRSIFEAYPDKGQLFCFDIQRNAFEVFSSGRGRIAIGQVEIRSHITEECEPVDFAVLHLGDQNLSAAVRRTNPSTPAQRDAGTFAGFAEEVRSAVARAHLPEVIRLFDRYFGDTAYSLTSLFRDEQRRILQSILDSTLDEMEGHLRTLYEDHTSLLHFLSLSGMPKPQALMLAAEFVLNADLRHVLEKDPLDAVRLRELLTQATSDEVPLHGSDLGYLASQRLKRAMLDVQKHPGDMAILESVLELTTAFHQLPFEVNLWQAQNTWNTLLHTPSTVEQESEWMEMFLELGRKLDLEVDDLIVEAP